MDRRNFLCKVTTAAGAVGAAGAVTPAAATASPPPDHAPKARETRSVTWKVKGFTCITCSVGLEVMLRGLNGVARANATYPGNQVMIGYDARVINEKTLKEFITVCGFSVV
jgi:anaerobic selenocysteine-containing dehydrogenase